MFDTHHAFNTISHQHLDTLVLWATGDYPDSALNLIECADGRFFVEVDFGDEFDDMQGISRPHLTPYEQPSFFDTRAEGQAFAIRAIQHQFYELSKRDDLHSWFENPC